MVATNCIGTELPVCTADFPPASDADGTFGAAQCRCSRAKNKPAEIHHYALHCFLLQLKHCLPSRQELRTGMSSAGATI